MVVLSVKVVEEFITAFKKVIGLQLFSWVPRLVEGYRREGMNMEDGEVKGQDIHKKLTMLSNERQRTQTESLGFKSEEHDSMQEFFNAELKSTNAKEVMRVVSLLFRDIKQAKLKRYFIEDLTKHVSLSLLTLLQRVLDFQYLTGLVFVVCKEQDERKKLEFLFNLFSNHKDQMSRKSMRDFAEIFKLGINFFSQRGNAVSKQEFIDDCVGIGIDFFLYEKARYAMIAMMGLATSTEEEEREAILSVLNNNHSVEGYIQESLELEDTYFVVEKQFFEAWCMNVEFLEEKNYIIKKEKMNVIDNATLLEPWHEKRMRDVVYNEDFILLPKFVFFALSKWYKATKVIDRKVIHYKSDKSRAISLFKQKKSITSG